jgi:hypothetical protein
MNKVILIIGDEAGLVLTISDPLIWRRYRIDSASDGDSGLSKAMHGEFALIIRAGAKRGSPRGAAGLFSHRPGAIFSRFDFFAPISYT